MQQLDEFSPDPLRVHTLMTKSLHEDIYTRRVIHHVSSMSSCDAMRIMEDRRDRRARRVCSSVMNHSRTSPRADSDDEDPHRRYLYQENHPHRQQHVTCVARRRLGDRRSRSSLMNPLTIMLLRMSFRPMIVRSGRISRRTNTS